MRRPNKSIVKTALNWTSEGKRKKGRPKMTWRRTVESEMKVMNQSWGTLTMLALDRSEWKSIVAALDTSRCNRFR